MTPKSIKARPMSAAAVKKLQLATELLAQHNQWRRGVDDLPMADSRELGLAIDLVVKYLRAKIC